MVVSSHRVPVLAIARQLPKVQIGAVSATRASRALHAASMAAHAALLERLARLSAPAPAAQRTRRKDRDNAGFAEFFGAIFKPVAEAEPATWPLIVAAGFQLRHCLAPYLVVLLPLACASQQTQKASTTGCTARSSSQACSCG